MLTERDEFENYNQGFERNPVEYRPDVTQCLKYINFHICVKDTFNSASLISPTNVIINTILRGI